MSDLAEATETLARLHGPGELKAMLLALLLPPGSQRARRAWEIENEALPGAAALKAAVEAIPAAARLPWFELGLERFQGQPLAVKQALLESTRRIMSARGVARPIDRLHWLVMRQRLGPPPEFGTASPESTLAQLDDEPVLAASQFAAHLARMVPSAEPAEGQAWFDAVTAPWKVRMLIPPMQPPDADTLVAALETLRQVGWMQRPVLLRGWVDAAVQLSPHQKLGDEAADALRLACLLLDTPPPPVLERHYAPRPGFPPAP